MSHVFVFLNNFYFRGNSTIYWLNISMNLYVMHRLLGNGGFDLFFLFASYLFLVMNLCFPFILKKVGSPIQTNDWHIPYPLTQGEGYHTALQSIISTLSLCHQEVHYVQKYNKSFFDWGDCLWILQSIVSEYNSQKQLWKYLKVLCSFFLTSLPILNKLFLPFFYW